MENRNIISEFQNFSTQEIKEKLIAQSFPCAILMEHWRGDYNFSVAIRNANAFGAREVFYLGHKKFDPRRAVGTHHYTEVNYLSDFEQVQALKNKYPIFIGVDNVPGACDISSFQWPTDKVLLIFGEETSGLSKEMLSFCDSVVSIRQYGSVRSLNAAIASAITLFSYSSYFNNPKNVGFLSP